MPYLTKTLEGLSALSQEIRLKTFRMLMSAGEDGLSAGLISTELDVAPNKLSAHLSVLTRAGLITVRRSGRNMIYSADVEAVSVLLKQVIETCCNNDPSLCRSLTNAVSGKASCS